MSPWVTEHWADHGATKRILPTPTLCIFRWLAHHHRKHWAGLKHLHFGAALLKRPCLFGGFINSNIVLFFILFTLFANWYVTRFLATWGSKQVGLWMTGSSLHTCQYIHTTSRSHGGETLCHEVLLYFFFETRFAVHLRYMKDGSSMHSWLYNSWTLFWTWGLKRPLVACLVV